MLGRLIATLAIVAALIAAAYFIGGLADVQVNGQSFAFLGVLQGLDIGHFLDSRVGGLKHQAISVSVADSAFSFQISWLGLILTAAVLLFLRLLRRR